MEAEGILPSGQIHPFDPGEFEDLLQHLAVRPGSPNPQEKVGGDFLSRSLLKPKLITSKACLVDDFLNMAELAGQILRDDGHFLIPILFQSALKT